MPNRQPKTKQLNFRASQETIDLLQSIADRNGLNLTQALDLALRLTDRFEASALPVIQYLAYLDTRTAEENQARIDAAYQSELSKDR